MSIKCHWLSHFNTKQREYAERNDSEYSNHSKTKCCHRASLVSLMREKTWENRRRTPTKSRYETCHHRSGRITPEIWEMPPCLSETQKICWNNGKESKWIKALSRSLSEKYQSRENRKQWLKFQKKKHHTKWTIIHMCHRPSKRVGTNQSWEESHANKSKPSFCRQFRKTKMFHPHNSQDNKTYRMFDSDYRQWRNTSNLWTEKTIQSPTNTSKNNPEKREIHKIYLVCWIGTVSALSSNTLSKRLK